MELVPTRRPGAYDPTASSRRGGPDLISAAHEARHVRPGEWVFAGYRKVKAHWALDAWVRDVREGKKASLGGEPGEWDAEHVLGIMDEEGEFIPHDPDERAMGGEPAAAKYIAYIGEVTR